MPVFSKQFYSDIVPENIELHTPLSVAIQAESPLGRKLIYTIVKGNELEEFTVDFNTGMILRYLYNTEVLFCVFFILDYFFFVPLTPSLFIATYRVAYIYFFIIFYLTRSFIEFEINPFFVVKSI